MKTTLATTAALAAALLLAGCSSVPPSPPEPTYEQAASNPFLGVNKDAVNRLIAGLDPRAASPMLVATIVNVNDLRKASPLGRTLSEQYASQLAASGFDVKEMKLRGDIFVLENTGELLLSREIKDIARTHNANTVLVGTYSSAAQLTFVSLKLVRTETGQIVRGFDYALPNNRDVVRLLAQAQGY